LTLINSYFDQWHIRKQGLKTTYSWIVEEKWKNCWRKNCRTSHLLQMKNGSKMFASFLFYLYRTTEYVFGIEIDLYRIMIFFLTFQSDFPLCTSLTYFFFWTRRVYMTFYDLNYNEINGHTTNTYMWLIWYNISSYN